MGAGASAQGGAEGTGAAANYEVADTTLSMAQCVDNPIIKKHLLLKHVDETTPSRKILNFILALEDLKKLDNADVVKQQANEILNTFLAADATFPLDDACLIESQVRTDCVTAVIQPCTDDNYVAHYKNIFAPILLNAFASLETVTWNEFIEDDTARNNLLKEKALKVVGIIYNDERKRLQTGSG
jgi:hypothetical protein